MLHSGGGPAWLVWLQDGMVGQAMRTSLLLYPVVEILHILGFALLVGSIVALDLRILGVARFLPAASLSQHLLPLAIIGFCLAAPMGLLLFITEAASIAQNPAFRLKLILIILAGVNALLFHRGIWRSVAGWNIALPSPTAAKISAGLSIALWLGVVSCGRLIAYF